MSDRCSDVGQPQNPSPPSTNTFMKSSCYENVSNRSTDPRGGRKRCCNADQHYQRCPAVTWSDQSALALLDHRGTQLDVVIGTTRPLNETSLGREQSTRTYVTTVPLSSYLYYF